MAPLSRGCPGSPWRLHLRALAALALLFRCHSRSTTAPILEEKSQLPAVSMLSNIAGYGWQPGFPCNLIAPKNLRCDDAGFVTSLNLPSTMGAYLPEAVGNLTRLTALTIRNNYFSDVLPQSLGRIRGLKSLILAGNLFSGSLPASMSALTALSILDISHNLFTGLIPAGLQRLPKLTKVNTSYNYFSGTASFSASCANVDLTQNCLSSSSSCAFRSSQRVSDVCAAACGVPVWENASSAAKKVVCSGKGQCFPSGAVSAGVATKWSCVCDKNYKTGKLFTCVKNGGQ